jgi:hypothetical protein
MNKKTVKKKPPVVTPVPTLADGQILDTGATWTDVVTAQSKVTAQKPKIYWPNHMIEQTASLVVRGRERFMATGPLSGFIARKDLISTDSSVQIQIGYGATDVEFNGLTIEQDRAGVKRMLMFSIMGGTQGCHIHRCALNNCTSDPFIFRNESAYEGTGAYQPMEDVHIHNNRIKEYWETGLNWREGGGKRFRLHDNHFSLFAGGHPDPRVSRPYAAVLNIEETRYPGLIEDYYLVNNIFESDLWNWSLGVGGQAGHGTDFNNSLGFILRKEQEPDYRVNRAFIVGNKFNGWMRGLWHIQGQTHGGSALFPGPSYVHYYDNEWRNCGDPTVDISRWGATGDKVFHGGNTIYRSSDTHTGIMIRDDGGLVDVIETMPNHIAG